MDLYHFELGFPDIRLPQGIMHLTYSRHAMNASCDDRYGYFSLPEKVNFSNCQFIELGVEYGEVVKVLVRIPYDHKRDLCLVIMPHTRFVKTVWINLHDDKHKTLDASKYRRPEKKNDNQRNHYVNGAVVRRQVHAG